ncbi:GIY-YIG nuclease family protein [Arenimonas sp.]|uniref:GIY-YIG nuclease family protein n=1 Tax=Arenimonas sp. TaxID=1872635 RepID=UPI0039E40031
MAQGYVYLLPLHTEDWLKLGISNDPLRRAREFSRRFHEAFDFDRALLVETESQKDAAAIERRFRKEFAVHRAPMPLTIRLEAGGYTEWYRGAYPSLSTAAMQLGEAGHRLHQPAREWFKQALTSRRNELHDWASEVLRQHGIDPDRPLRDPLPAAAHSLLSDALDAYRHFGVDVSARLPVALRGNLS